MRKPFGEVPTRWICNDVELDYEDVHGYDVVTLDNVKKIIAQDKAYH